MAGHRVSRISGNSPLRSAEKEKSMSSTKDILKAVEAELDFDPLVDPTDITVKNLNGEVALNGTVPNYPQYLEAAAAAQRVEGVKNVHNHLRACPCRQRRSDRTSSLQPRLPRPAALTEGATMRHLADAARDSMDWRDGAACRHRDPELFFPEGTARRFLLLLVRARNPGQVSEGLAVAAEP
jgi:hypothetical protein